MAHQDEIKEVFSPQEEVFDRWRRKIGLILGPILALVVYYIPFPLPPSAHLMATLMAGTMIYFITEPIPLPITALLAPMLAIAFGIGRADEVLSSFGNPVVFLLLGGFLIARAMEYHHISRRFSLFILSQPWVGHHPYRVMVALGGVTAFISMWISNTAATAMMFPIAIGLLHSMGLKNSNAYATGMMLMIAFSASIGGIGTPIGTAPNLIGIGMIEKYIARRISFVEWVLLCVPIMLVMCVALYLLLISLHRSKTNVPKKAIVISETMGEWRTGEKNTLVVFLVAVFLWVLPGILGLIFGGQSETVKTYYQRLPEGGVAILAASLLFFLPIDRAKGEYTLHWEEAVKIDWGTLLLFGGGLALGDLMFKTGLSKAMGQGALTFLHAPSLWGITALSILLAIVISEIGSNTASANMVIPVVIAIAQTAGVNPIPPALGATLGASFGFMLPISTPPNAIVYGSRLIPIQKMIRTGFIFDLIGWIIIWVGLRLLCPLVGLS